MRSHLARRAALVALVAGLGVGSVLAGDALDPALVGTWTAVTPDHKNPNIKWNEKLTIAADGSARVELSTGGKSLPPFDAKFEGHDGIWKSTAGKLEDGGAYHLDGGTLELTYKDGHKVSWKRVGAPPAPGGNEAPPTAPAAPPTVSVDPRFAAVWKSEEKDGWTAVFDVATDGHFTYTLFGEKPVPSFFGLVDARDGNWVVYTEAGVKVNWGTYRVTTHGDLETVDKTKKEVHYYFAAPPVTPGTFLRVPSPMSANPWPYPGLERFVDGLDAFESGDLESALAAFGAAAEADDDNALYHCALGVAKNLAGKGGADEYARAEKLAPGLANNASWAEIKRFEQAPDQQREHLARAPEQADAWAEKWARHFDDVFKQENQLVRSHYCSIYVGARANEALPEVYDPPVHDAIWEALQRCREMIGRARDGIETQQRALRSKPDEKRKGELKARSDDLAAWQSKCDDLEKAIAASIGPLDRRATKTTANTQQGRVALHEAWRTAVQNARTRTVEFLKDFNQKMKETLPDLLADSSASLVAGLAFSRAVREAYLPVASGTLRAIDIISYRRAMDRLPSGAYARAASDLSLLLKVFPNDPALLAGHAAAEYRLGDRLAVRAELTHLLSVAPSDSAAYLGRANVSAQLGRAKRARADVATLAALDPEAGARLAPRIEARLQALGEDPSVAPLDTFVAGLAEACAAPWRSQDDLARAGEAAFGLVRAMTARRVFADETYTDQLKVLHDAVVKDSKNPDRNADLAWFLFEEATSVVWEQVEPKGPGRPYRYQDLESRSQELAWASQRAEAALARSPAHPRALATKARLIMWHGQYGDAETIIRQALQTHPEAPELLVVFADLQEIAGAQRHAKSDDLRTPAYWTDAWYSYTRWPSRAELDKADQLDAQAAQLHEIALAAIKKGAEARTGTAEGFYLKGLLAWQADDLSECIASLEQSVKLDPRNFRACNFLARAYGAANQTKAHAFARARALNLRETTAGPLLRFASGEICRTAWKSAREALETARSLDPADARVPAYLAMVAEGEKKPEEAMCHFREAIAIEEARARLRGGSWTSFTTVPPEEIGLELALLLRLGQLHLDAHQDEDARWCFARISALFEHVAQSDYTAKAARSLLPDWRDDASWHPEPEPLVGFIGRAWLGAGIILKHEGKNDEAIRAFQVSRSAKRFARSLQQEGGDQSAVAPIYLRSSPWEFLAKAEDNLRAMGVKIVKGTDPGRNRKPEFPLEVVLPEPHRPAPNTRR